MVKASDPWKRTVFGIPPVRNLPRWVRSLMYVRPLTGFAGVLKRRSVFPCDSVSVVNEVHKNNASDPTSCGPWGVTQNDRWFRHLDTRNSVCSISVFVRGLPARRAPAFLATRRDFGISLFLSQRSGTQRSNRGEAAHHTLPFISTLSPRLP
ncbi:hypothetical protein TGP89_263215 [Toxoplasma gondii p89]|uniref:Uncharacterized protein n=1 Tax=Toxoplasma gondii p89 TaxID=943119 RepID=A0A086JRZ5_TOXGO|nr:hypothetical protein TGP89_263215 [Toxoplasma gondii p89]